MIFFYLLILTTLPCEFVNHRAGSQLKIYIFYCSFGRFRPVGRVLNFIWGLGSLFTPVNLLTCQKKLFKNHPKLREQSMEIKLISNVSEFSKTC